MNPVEQAITAEVEDRFRAASEALTERFPDSGMPPLNLSARSAHAPSRRELWGRTRNWLIPLAAAAAVIAAIAASLAIAGLSARDTGGQPAGPLPSGPEGTPPYFVMSTGGSQAGVIVGSTATGQTIATVRPSRPYSRLAVLTGSADDHSFLLGESRALDAGFNLALLHVAPENGQVKLTQLRIFTESSLLCSMALSPDGSKLAIAYSPVCTNRYRNHFTLYIKIYDLRTGASRLWSSAQPIGNPAATSAHRVLVTWRNDQILGFDWVNGTGHKLYYARFDTTAPGGHFPTGGLQLPWNTLQAVLTANGAVATASAAGGITVVVSNAASMGPLYPGEQARQSILWVNPANTVFIVQGWTAKTQVAVIGAGRYIPLSIQAHGRRVIW